MDYNFVIIGAGVVGLATAEYLSRKNYKILVVEKENKIGTGVSSRNSEVIHAGIYYPKDSLKSKLCIRGKNLLYEWCQKNNVPYRNTGKFIIATDKNELELLENLRLNAFNAGMEDLHFVNAKKIKSEEPLISCTGGLFSPSTGIISVHEFMSSLKNVSESRGVDYVFCSRPLSVAKTSIGSYQLDIMDSSSEITRIETERIINCAGLYSDKVAGILGINDEAYKIRFSKGNYFRYQSKSNLVKHLVYPVPVPKLKGLGTHITIDLDGRMKFGPDVEDMNTNIEEYSVNPDRKQMFYESIKKYFPTVEEDKLLPDMSGIRPRLAIQNSFLDFIINEESKHSLRGIINLIGIESPGLTASMAIAEHIENLI